MHPNLGFRDLQPVKTYTDTEAMHLRFAEMQLLPQSMHLKFAKMQFLPQAPAINQRDAVLGQKILH